jgi:uncharacterized membrane protein
MTVKIRRIGARTGIGVIPLVNLLVGVGLTLLVIVSRPHEGDPGVFFAIAERLAHGAVAYGDYAVEYPPLGLVPIVLPRLLSGPSRDAYQTLFSVLSLALALATAAAIWWLARRRWAAETSLNSTLLFVGLALAGAPLVVWRFDILPAFLTTLALVAYAARRPGWSGMALGFGALAKIYPAFLVPVFAAAHLFERRVRPAVIVVVGAAVAVGAALAETFLVAGPGALSFLTYQQDRGVEIESVTGGVAMLAGLYGGQPTHVAFGFGSWEVTSPLIETLAVPQTLFQVAVVALLLRSGWISFSRDASSYGKIQPRTLVQYSLATVLAVVLTNKVLSPQYLVWILPFVALLPARRSLLFLLVICLTIWEYPLAFHSLVTLDRVAVIALNVRNAALVLFYVWTAWPSRAQDATPSRLHRRDVRHPSN